MEIHDLLWIDLQSEEASLSHYAGVNENYHAYWLSDTRMIRKTIREIKPKLICFDFDYPGSEGLKALQNTKEQFPNIPILMLTMQHSERLAIWALRARVWDYFVKPIVDNELENRIALLVKFNNKHSNRRQSRDNYMPFQPAPVETCFKKDIDTQARAIDMALSYIHKHLGDPISLNIVASLCNMSPSQFSRTFQRYQGITFRKFLVEQRIKQAIELFENPKISILEVALSVGFNDPSHFARAFRYNTGSNPSRYRLQMT